MINIDELMVHAKKAKELAQQICLGSSNKGTAYLDEKNEEFVIDDLDDFSAELCDLTLFSNDNFSGELKWDKKKETDSWFVDFSQYDLCDSALEDYIDTEGVERRAKEIQLGNCGTMSSVAFNYLKQQSQQGIKKEQDFSIAFAGLDNTDHNFLLLSAQKLCSYDRQKLHEIPNETVIVCDPWADIVCLFEDHMKIWKLRMKEWDNQHRRIWNKFTDEAEEGWLSPLVEKWFELPAVQPFYLIRSCYPCGDNMVEEYY